MSAINFDGMTGAQAFRAIDKDGGVTDSDISANMGAWAGKCMAEKIKALEHDHRLEFEQARVAWENRISDQAIAKLEAQEWACKTEDRLRKELASAQKASQLANGATFDLRQDVEKLKAELKESDDMLKKIAELCEMHERRWEFLHTSNTDEQGYEWSVMRVKYKDGNLVDALNTLSDLSDLDAEIKRVCGVDAKDCPNCGSPNGKCLGKFSCISQQLCLPAR